MYQGMLYLLGALAIIAGICMLFAGHRTDALLCYTVGFLCSINAEIIALKKDKQEK